MQTKQIITIMISVMLISTMLVVILISQVDKSQPVYSVYLRPAGCAVLTEAGIQHTSLNGGTCAVSGGYVALGMSGASALLTLPQRKQTLTLYVNMVEVIAAVRQPNHDNGLAS